jgi:hypothetical protein
VFGRLRSQQSILDPELLRELFVLGDVLADTGIIEPAIAFATYRKKMALPVQATFESLPDA